MAQLALNACSTDAPDQNKSQLGLGGDSSYWAPAGEEQGSQSLNTAENNPWTGGFSDEIPEGMAMPPMKPASSPSSQQKENNKEDTPQPLVPGNEEPGQSLEGANEPSASDDGTATQSGPKDDPPSESFGPPETIPTSKEAEVPQLRIVGYKEGLGADKRLEIFNPATSVDQACAIQIYSNGGTSPWRSWSLPSPIVHGANIILCTEKETSPSCNHRISGSGYNGNDALVLLCGEVVVDSFGRVGEDPTSSWSSISPTTGEIVDSKDAELVRCPGDNDTTITDIFDIAQEWLTVMPDENKEMALERCGLNPLGGMGGAGGPN